MEFPKVNQIEMIINRIVDIAKIINLSFKFVDLSS